MEQLLSMELLTESARLLEPRGLKDKASDFGSEDWGFKSLRGCLRHVYSTVILFQRRSSKRGDEISFNIQPFGGTTDYNNFSKFLSLGMKK